MPTIEKSIVVNRPPEVVFAYIDVPTNLVHIWPNMSSITDVQPAEGGGNHFRWVYRMAGIPLDGASQVVEHTANQRIVNKNSGAMDSTVTFQFAAVGAGTRVSFRSAYELPGGVFGKLAEPLIHMQNESDIDTLLKNLKRVLES